MDSDARQRDSWPRTGVSCRQPLPQPEVMAIANSLSRYEPATLVMP
jgi:hypothetical protein